MATTRIRRNESIEKKGAIVLATFRRSELLEKVLNSIYGAKNSEKYYKVIVFQGNDPASLEIINSYLDEMTIFVRVSGKGRSPLENITSNYMTALDIAFEYCHADYAIEIEDDSLIAPFALNFIDEMFSRYGNKTHFRGVNLGSYESDPKLAGTYSKLRTGFHATHGVITRNSWAYLSKQRIRSRIRSNPLDSTVEAFWKSGFVITPNLSQCENFGWVNGTHASSKSDNPHYLKLSTSYTLAKETEEWVLRNIDHSWHPKPIQYRSFHNIRFLLKLMVDEAWNTSLGCKIKSYVSATKRKVKSVIRSS